MNILTKFPSHLFVGSEEQTADAVIHHLQTVFCSHQNPVNAGCFCSECKKIKNFQHPNVVWIKPENKYVLEDLDIIFEKIRFNLEPGQQFFFILQKAHTLSTICANKLLKTLEEPPRGYFFFLLTHNEFAILPTIKSRSFIQLLTQANQQSNTAHPLLVFFYPNTKFCDPIAFEQEIQKQDLSEQESIDLIHEHLQMLRQQLISLQKECANQADLENLALQKQFQRLVTLIAFFEQQLHKPPQAGSATLFWKKIFLTFPRQQ